MEFIKMQGAGNDFILFDGEKNADLLSRKDFEQKIKALCDRHFGIGGDGLMFSEMSREADIKMTYYNSDGSIAALCGNGIRCFAKFVYEENIIRREEFNIETLAGIIDVSLTVSGNFVESVAVHIGKPVFDAPLIPVKTERQRDGNELIEEDIEIDAVPYKLYCLRVGVPHAVIFINDIDSLEVEALGRKIENHPLFPERTNVNFAKIYNREMVDLFTWERGAGRTLACGTGACAVAVVGGRENLLNRRVDINTEGGELIVEIEDSGEIILAGEATTVFKGFVKNL